MLLSFTLRWCGSSHKDAMKAQYLCLYVYTLQSHPLHNIMSLGEGMQHLPLSHIYVLVLAVLLLDLEQRCKDRRILALRESFCPKTPKEKGQGQKLTARVQPQVLGNAPDFGNGRVARNLLAGKEPEPVVVSRRVGARQTAAVGQAVRRTTSNNCPSVSVSVLPIKTEIKSQRGLRPQ